MAYIKKGAAIPTSGKGSKLSDKQALFVDAYLVNLNGSEAVKQAGYKTNNPNRLASELLRHPLVRKTIDEKLDARKETFEIQADMVLARLQKIAMSQEEDNPQAAIRSWELLGKYLGLWKDRTEISGPDGEAIKMEQKLKEDVRDFTSTIAKLAKRGGTDDLTLVSNG